MLAGVQLKRSLGLLDVTLFFVIAGSNFQWVATAAASGPSALTVWVIGAFAMFVPVSVVVIYLSSIYPEEGGMYIWSKRVFGRFSGFMTGWTYWTTNLPYFPALLYFMVGNALFFWPGGAAYSQNAIVFMSVSLIALAAGTILNIFGLDVEKWLTNIGAGTRWAATLLLIGLGMYAWHVFGSPNPIHASSLVPGVAIKDLIFWSTIAFAWTGPESASFMAGEIRNPRRTIPLGLAFAAPAIATIYILGTLAILVTVNSDTVNPQYGVMQAISEVAHRAGWNPITPVAAVLVAISCMASLGAWLGSISRIPFVAGIDKYLPAAFGRMHPKYHSPVASLLTQALLSGGIILLGQGGTSVHGAYEVLVSLTVLITMVPFLYLFAAGAFVRDQPLPGSFKIPGGKATVVFCSVIGFITTLGTMILSAIPAPDEPNKPLAVVKVVGLSLLMVGAGAVAYYARRNAGTVSTPLPAESSSP